MCACKHGYQPHYIATVQSHHMHILTMNNSFCNVVVIKLLITSFSLDAERIALLNTCSVGVEPLSVNQLCSTSTTLLCTEWWSHSIMSNVCFLTPSTTPILY